MQILIRVLVGLVVAAIVAGSLVSGMTRWPAGVSPGMTHLLAYSCLGGLMMLALGGRRGGWWLALGVTVLIGTGVEFLQMLVPEREFSFFDLGRNVLGAAIGVAGAAVLGRVTSVLGFG